MASIWAVMTSLDMNDIDSLKKPYVLFVQILQWAALKEADYTLLQNFQIVCFALPDNKYPPARLVQSSLSLCISLDISV